MTAEAPPQPLYLADANILAFTRKYRGSLAHLIGCAPDAVALPLMAWMECVGPIRANRALVADYGQWVAGAQVIASTPDRITAARAWADRYAGHGATFEDMLIARSAVDEGRILVSTNWRDFHLLPGLTFVDARVLYQGSPVPNVLALAEAVTCPVLPPPTCCANLVRQGILSR